MPFESILANSDIDVINPPPEFESILRNLMTFASVLNKLPSLVLDDAAELLGANISPVII